MSLPFGSTSTSSDSGPAEQSGAEACEGEKRVVDDAVGRSGSEWNDVIESGAPRNFLLLAAYEVVLRVAWIFKTESVIIPAFLDTLTGGAGFARGLLPLLSRTGQSIVPLLWADRLGAAPRKTRALGRTTLLMSLLFSLVALIAALRSTTLSPWLPALFLSVYILFFAATGLNQLVTGTVQGKLVRFDRRGRLQGVSGLLGSVAAIAAALTLLQHWLNWPDGSGFVPIFVFTASGFAVAAILTPFLVEPADPPVTEEHSSAREVFRSAWGLYQSDQSFRRAARVAMLLISVVLLFPHFQWLAKQQFGAAHDQLVKWVVVQNIGVAVFSLLCGWMADWWGNRIVIRSQCVVIVLAPLTALGLTHPACDPNVARDWYWVVFLLLGVSPVVMRTISNYTLELAEPQDHPRYLSTMRICYLVPLLLAPLTGLLLDLFPAGDYFKAALVFGMVTLLVAIGGVMTFWMSEPRKEPGVSSAQGTHSSNADCA